MKIGVMRPYSYEMPYGKQYTTEYFEKLWKKFLFDNLDEKDEVQWLERTNQGDLEKLAEDYGALIGVWIKDNAINESFLDNHPSLQYISTLAHGYGVFDYSLISNKGVTVSNTIYGDSSIAQYTFALLLEVCNKVGNNSEYYKKQKWSSQETINKKRLVKQVELKDKVFGIIGLGNIGFQVAKIADGFGMNVIAYSRHDKQGEKYFFIQQVSYEELLSQSDIISIHCDLNGETRQLVNHESFEQMKQGVIILNTARGEIIDEKALVEALKDGQVSAVGLDVVIGEPLKRPCELMEFDSVVVTEHIAAATLEARERSIRIAADNFLKWRNK